MPSNRGATTLKPTRRPRNTMRDYDRLPPALRAWVATAQLPWGPKSVLSAYHKAVARTGDAARALAELDRLQSELVARDAGQVWSASHPAAQGRGAPANF